MAKYITPAVTPLNEDRSLDLEGAGKLYDFLIQSGVDGILVLGSIGEFFAFSLEQKKQLISYAVKYIDHRVPVIIGTADTVVENVLALSEFALSEGADAVIVVSPYYFSLTGDSLESYYDMLAEKIRGKLYIYNFPDRTGYEIPADVIRRLALRHPNIAGVKDTISGMDHTREIIKAVKPYRPDFEVFSGFDDNFAHNILSGGDGCIGGLSNFAPDVTRAWVRAFREGNMSAVAEIQKKIDRLMSIYSAGTPFVPYIKRAMELRGIGVKPYASMPLPEPDEAASEKLLAVMTAEGLI
ncbi:MAG: dihydrodipicolinate synthase family protein [Lachnospiraceae bacterium]|nr:dihydrodipicolinate synthase family protein [Lachnospiraceae bacterium]